MALYQQGKQTLTVIVRGEGVTTTEDAEKTASKSPKEEQEQQQETTSKSKFMSKRVKMITATHAVATTIGIVTAGMNYLIGDIGGTTGDKNYQEMVQRDIEMVKDVFDVGTATIMGAWYGSRGGMAAGVITAGLSFTTAVASKTNKYLNRERDYKIETFKMNNEINYARSRANINMTNGRLR